MHKVYASQIWLPSGEMNKELLYLTFICAGIAFAICITAASLFIDHAQNACLSRSWEERLAYCVGGVSLFFALASAIIGIIALVVLLCQ